MALTVCCIQHTHVLHGLLSHWFDFLVVSVARFTVSPHFLSSFSISHSLSVISMQVFHNSRAEKCSSIISPPQMNANPMTCWQNSAIEQEITGSSAGGSYDAKGPHYHAHAIFMLEPNAFSTAWFSEFMLITLSLLFHIFLVCSCEIIVQQDVS